MRDDIRISYEDLEDIRKKLDDYNTNSTNLCSSLKSLKYLLASQKSDSLKEVEKLCDDLVSTLDNNDTYITNMLPIIRSFIDNCATLVPEGLEGGLTRVDAADIKSEASIISNSVSELRGFAEMSIQNMLNHLENFDGYAYSEANDSWYTDLSGNEDLTPEQHAAYKRNFEKLEGFRTRMILPYVQSMQEHLSNVDNLIATYLEPVKGVDTYHHSLLEELYDLYTPSEDKEINSVEFAFDEIESFVTGFVKPAAISIGLVVLTAVCPIAGIVVGAALTVYGTYTTLEASNFEETGITGLCNYFRKTFTDTFDTPEGIACFAGGVTGSIVGGVVGAKIAPYAKGIKIGVKNTIKNNKGLGIKAPKDFCKELKGNIVSEVKNVRARNVAVEGASEAEKIKANDEKSNGSLAYQTSYDKSSVGAKNIRIISGIIHTGETWFEILGHYLEKCKYLLLCFLFIDTFKFWIHIT